jgi:hypothetical protein
VRTVARALEGILAEIQGGAAFPITRLTRVKKLCADQAAAEAFAAFMAGRALAKLLDRERPREVPAERWAQFIVLARAGVAGLERYLADRSPETERALREQRHALYQSQCEHKNIPYGALRLIVCWQAMQVETALDCVLTRVPEARARYGYELASDYVKRYESSVLGDLNGASAEPLADVITFWHGYADALAAGEMPAGKPEQRKGRR